MGRGMARSLGRPEVMTQRERGALETQKVTTRAVVPRGQQNAWAGTWQGKEALPRRQGDSSGVGGRWGSQGNLGQEAATDLLKPTGLGASAAVPQPAIQHVWWPPAQSLEMQRRHPCSAPALLVAFKASKLEAIMGCKNQGMPLGGAVGWCRSAFMLCLVIRVWQAERQEGGGAAGGRRPVRTGHVQRHGAPTWQRVAVGQKSKITR